jgi:tRNA A-37 threonylcarbamoyl transferase component Bud32
MNYHDTSALTPGTRIDQYAISDLLGRGGFGITYLVRDEALQRDFALKEYFPEGLVRREGTSVRFVSTPNSEDDYRWGLRKFYDEARLLAQFSHPNIVSVRRVFEANNSAYMLLDFVKGRTLEQWLQGLDSPPTQEELDLISVPLLSALELVHANRAWHLDISPDNIMIRSADGAPILLDFGASRFELKQHSQLVSALVFKSGYSAPEQYISNAERYGPWTDIYAFAATLYRALSGKRPREATARQLEDDLTPAALLGKGRYRPQFLQAVDWALKISPRARPQSIAEWRKSLLEGEGSVVAPAMTRILTGRSRTAAGATAGWLALFHKGASAKPGIPLWMMIVAMVAALGIGAGATYVLQEQSRKAQEVRVESEKREKLERERREQEEKRLAEARAESERLEKANRDLRDARARIEGERRQQTRNVALVGNIILTESNRKSADECRSACLAKDGCKAFEFRITGKLCYLYRAVYREFDSTDAVSGRWD